MRELGAWVVENFFWVNRRGGRRWDVEVEEVECRGTVHEGTEEEGDMEWRITGKAGENSGAWPCSDVIIFEGGVGLIRAGCHTLQYKTAHQFKFRLARRRDFYGLDTLLTRCRVEETQESLVRLDAACRWPLRRPGR